MVRAPLLSPPHRTTAPPHHRTTIKNTIDDAKKTINGINLFKKIK